MKATAKGKRKLFLEVMPQARTDELDGDQNKLRRAGQQECLPSWAAPSVDVRERQTSEGSRPHLMGRESIDRDTRIRQLYFQLPEDDTAQGKGAVLEELTCEVFSSIPGFVVIDRNSNTKTEEIDLVIRNEGTDLRWRSESALILVECKNWHTRRVGKNEFVLFKEKLQNRYGRAKLGFLICTEHFAETADIERLRSSKSDFLIVLIDSDGLEQLVRSGDRGSTLRQFTDRATLA
jgi:Holliday junction resolvase-like predicted endonuclease